MGARGHYRPSSKTRQSYRDATGVGYTIAQKWRHPRPGGKKAQMTIQSQTPDLAAIKERPRHWTDRPHQRDPYIDRHAAVIARSQIGGSNENASNGKFDTVGGDDVEYQPSPDYSRR